MYVANVSLVPSFLNHGYVTTQYWIDHYHEILGLVYASLGF